MRTVHVFVHLFIHHQLELRTSKIYSSKRQNLVQKKNIDVQNLENILKIPLWCFSLGFFFGTIRLFLNLFGLHQRVSPSFLSIFCNTMDVKKSQRVPLLHFWYCDTVQKYTFKNFLWKFSKISQGEIFFHNLQPTGVSQCPKGPLFYNFEP